MAIVGEGVHREVSEKTRGGASGQSLEVCHLVCPVALHIDVTVRGSPEEGLGGRVGYLHRAPGVRVVHVACRMIGG